MAATETNKATAPQHRPCLLCREPVAEVVIIRKTFLLPFVKPHHAVHSFRQDIGLCATHAAETRRRQRRQRIAYRTLWGIGLAAAAVIYLSPDRFAIMAGAILLLCILVGMGLSFYEVLPLGDVPAPKPQALRRPKGQPDAGKEMQPK